jgi:putative YhdH/YhfP family quinone oxidoreductase
MPSTTIRCYLVEEDAHGRVSSRIAQRPLDDLPPGDVLVRVAYSSLNYKDALAATGHPGVNRLFPHVPGVDAAGTVVESGVYEWVEGDRVLVQGFQMGSNRWGGYAEYIRVPQAWVLPLPEGLSLRESMILGTGGLTAALCVDALQKHGVLPSQDEVVVTGATGGVGSMAVAILSKLGYPTAAVSGKADQHPWLQSLGAARVLPREEVDDRTDRPLLHQRWAGAVDAVGGNILSTILRSTRYGGCVAACGLTAGSELSLTVYPFILRAVTLTGIDAAESPIALRHESWKRLASEWKPDHLEEMAREIELAELPQEIEKILAGEMVGRAVVRIGGEA